MAHFAIFAPPLRGHYRPYSALAAELLERGHQVTFIHQEEARQLVEAKGARFVPVGKAQAPLDSWTAPMAKIRGILGLGRTIARMNEFTTMLCRESPALLRSLAVDVVIADQLEPAGALVAEHLGLPWVTVATTLPMNREGAVPPPFVNWPYDPSLKARKRNQGGWLVSDFILRSFSSCIERNAARLGLSGRRNMEDCFSPTLQITQLVRGLDFPRVELPPSFAYAGPFRSAIGGSFTLPPSDGRPTAYCTLGTLQGSRLALFERVAEACVLAGVRLVLTHGGRGDPVEMARLPGDPLVYDWLPQEAVLGQVDLVICHGGMMTVLDCCSAALPMVVIPLAFEQPGIAARVQWSGAGIMLARRASANLIARSMRRILEEPAYRSRARALAAEISAAGGAGQAADLVEQATGAGARTAAPTRQHAERDDARGDSQSGSR